MYRLLALLLTISTTTAHYAYITKIPNGPALPDPCGNGVKFGSGHWDLNGGGPRNPFGDVRSNYVCLITCLFVNHFKISWVKLGLLTEESSFLKKTVENI